MAASPVLRELEVARFDAISSSDWHSFTIRNAVLVGDRLGGSQTGGRGKQWWGCGVGSTTNTHVAVAARARDGVVEIINAPTSAKMLGFNGTLSAGIRLQFSGM